MSARDRRAAHDAARRLLDELGLSTYLFDVSRTDDGWTVRVDRPLDGCWVRSVLHATDLPACLDDPRARAHVAARWRLAIFESDAA